MKGLVSVKVKYPPGMLPNQQVSRRRRRAAQLQRPLWTGLSLRLLGYDGSPASNLVDCTSELLRLLCDRNANSAPRLLGARDGSVKPVHSHCEFLTVYGINSGR